MSFEKYDIVFSGALIEGTDDLVARQKVAALFRASAEQVQRMFTGSPVVIKRDVDMDTAIRYRVAFRNAGALIDIIPTGSSVAPTPPLPNVGAVGTASEDPDAISTWTLSPPGSGDLAGFAPRIVATPVPDISDLSLAPEGTEFPAPPEPPPPIIDTDALSVAPPGFSLEDCAEIEIPPLLPDISDMQLEKQDDDGDQPPKLRNNE